jgi:hypothetical protein
VSILESIRRWIDGEIEEDPLASVDEQSRPRRVWEEFLVKVAREIENVMQREMFTPPGGPTYIPPEYIVYLSNDDDRDWQGEKRRGLEQGLFHVLSERAREIAGATQLATKQFAVELRVDGTLNRGEFRVQPVWDATESGHTMVTTRPKIGATTTPDLAPPSEGNGEQPEAEVTRVRARPQDFYSVEIWREGVRQTVVPVSKQSITIGRGSKSIEVDLPLKGDAEVSRVHATLEMDNTGKFWLTSKGRNATLVEGRELPREEAVELRPDERVEICSYTLRVQPK